MAIVDQYGCPVSSRLLNAADKFNRSRPYWQTRAEDVRKAIDLNDWRTVLSVSRRIWANNGVVKGAIAKKAMHSVGRAWSPQFHGEDKVWGELAEEWLEDEWYKLCDVRGTVYDFKTGLYLDSISIDRDGDVGILLTETSENHYPKIQRIPAHRIGQRDQCEEKIKEGKYKGYRISHGVIYNRQGGPIAYRFLGDTVAEDEDIPADRLILFFDPEWDDQPRGIPVFSHALNDIRDADQSEDWERLAQLINSSIVLLETNESGGLDANAPGTLLGGQDSESASITQEQFDGGMTRYYKAGTGGKLEAHTASRPGADWETFQDRIARKSLQGVWPYSLVWKPDGMNGVQERSVIEDARALIRDRQDLLEANARRIIGYAVSKAMKLGILPAYKGKDVGGFFKWKFTMPPKFSIDHGRDGNSRRADYLLGHRNLEEILAEQGYSYADHMEDREEEALDIIVRAQSLAKKTGVDFNIAFNLISERNSSAVKGSGTDGAPASVDNNNNANA
jgi:hypothetical protein